MKKRIISMVLALSMCLSLLTPAALAADDAIVGEESLTASESAPEEVQEEIPEDAVTESEEQLSPENETAHEDVSLPEEEVVPVEENPTADAVESEKESASEQELLTETEPAAAGEALITPRCQVAVSSEQDAGNPSAQLAVDGNTVAPSQWASAPMKNGTEPNQQQTPQWLVVDLGENVTAPVSIEKILLHFNMKVWPMVYEVQTSSDKGQNDVWDTLVRVERDPFDGAVKNGANQNIADETGNTTPAQAANTDTITLTSNPALKEGAAVERYVRFYVEKVNTLAPGNNVCLREIQIFAAEDSGAGELPKPEGDIRNLVLRQPITVSANTNGTDPAGMVDGSSETYWISDDLKNFVGHDTTQDETQQTPQWIQMDLGVSDSVIESIKIAYKNKVWAMEYEVQTTDTPNDENSWQRVAYVKRPSANAFVTNGAGQNIADTSANTDTITVSSVPALQQTQLKRYVRVYIHKTNAQAPGGNNINIQEIEIQGVNSNVTLPLEDIMNSVEVNSPAAADTQITLPETQGADLFVRSSDVESVVANDGTISQWNIGSRKVTLLLRLANQERYLEKNVTVKVPDHHASYPQEWFPSVKNPNPKPEVIPTVQEWYGYEGNFTLTEKSKIVLNDAANVDLQKAAKNMQADVKEICGVTLPIVTGTAPTGSHDIYIESLTNPAAYDLGKEGYLMVTNAEGLHIYAPTYTGCLYGTITAEQILWQAKDHRTIPMGIMRDYPNYEIRGLMLDVARTPYRYQQLQDYAKIMLWYKMSEYHLHINDNDNSNINGATFDTHAGFHRLESDTFPSLHSEIKHAGIPQDLINPDYYENNADYQGNPTYTKDQWRALNSLCQDKGINMMTELDMPGHSLLYNKYAQQNPDHIDWLNGGTMLAHGSTGNSGYQELLDLVGKNKDRALRFAEALWQEYTGDENPAITSPHIGADEYWMNGGQVGTAFVQFADAMRQVIQNNLGQDTKIRMWGAGTGKFATASEVLGKTPAELAQDYQLDIWTTHYDNAAARAAEGFQIVNTRDCYLYGNPGRRFRDVPNAEFLFHDWNPTMFGGGNPLLGEPNLIGAKAVIWGDQSQEGMTEQDIHQRVLRAIAIMSEKTWGGTDEDDTFTEYEMRADRLAEGPGTEIAMEIDSESALVLDYDFANVSADGKTVYDASGNGYDAALTGGKITDGWLKFDGKTLLESPLKTMSYPYTASFDLKLSGQDAAANTKESSLFSGYDGRIQVAGHNGKLSADVNYFTRDFGYTVPTEKTVHIEIVGTFQATRLYVNGKLVTFLSQKADQDGLLPGAISTLCSSVPLPLEKIGQDLHGQMANLKVYNKALSAQEIADAAAGKDDGLVNVAQNTYAGGESYRSGDKFDDGEQRTCIAMKAIDGEAFTDPTNTSSSEMSSYWRGDHADSSITVDLGQTRDMSSVVIQWAAGGIGRDFKIQTSLDGKNFTDAKTVTSNTNSVTTINFENPVAVRYVKMQGGSSNHGGVYKMQEFQIYEAVDKSELNTLLKEAEKIVAGLRFEETDSAVIFARAISENPLATKAEVQKAVDALKAYLEQRQPADYSAVDAAIAKANALNKNDYKDFSAVEQAIAAVVRGKDIIEQETVNGYAAAIENAIKALEYKPADYSAVDAAIAKANALNKNDYKDFSAVEKAITAVVRGKDITEQETVNGYAAAIENAIKALEYKSADYSAVDAAIAKANALNKNDYKDFSAVEQAIAAVVRGKDITEQETVNGYAAAIENAIKALEYKTADYSVVDAAIAKANALNKNDYKDFSAVEKAIAAVVRGKDITEQETVNGYAAAIENAIKALKKQDVEPEHPEETTKPSDVVDNNSTAKPSSPQTGDNRNVVLWISLTALSLVGAMAVAVMDCKKHKNG